MVLVAPAVVALLSILGLPQMQVVSAVPVATGVCCSAPVGLVVTVVVHRAAVWPAMVVPVEPVVCCSAPVVPAGLAASGKPEAVTVGLAERARCCSAPAAQVVLAEALQRAVLLVTAAPAAPAACCSAMAVLAGLPDLAVLEVWAVQAAVADSCSVAAGTAEPALTASLPYSTAVTVEPAGLVPFYLVTAATAVMAATDCPVVSVVKVVLAVLAVCSVVRVPQGKTVNRHQHEAVPDVSQASGWGVISR